MNDKTPSQEVQFAMMQKDIEYIKKGMDTLIENSMPRKDIEERLSRGSVHFTKIDGELEKCVKKDDVGLVYKTIAIAGTGFGAIAAWVSVKLTGG